MVCTDSIPGPRLETMKEKMTAARNSVTNKYILLSVIAFDIDTPRQIDRQIITEAGMLFVVLFSTREGKSRHNVRPSFLRFFGRSLS